MLQRFSAGLLAAASLAALAGPAGPAAATSGPIDNEFRIDTYGQRFFCEQDDPIDPKFAQHGLRTDMLMVTASYLSARPSYSWREFARVEPRQIRRTLQHYQHDRLGWTNAQARAFEGVIVLDIEGEAMPPNWINILHETERDPQRRALRYFLNGWKLRIRAVKEIFPNAKIGVWNPVLPPANGNAPEAFRDEVLFVAACAKKWKVFDQVDFHCPRLYPGWGTTDFEGDRHEVRKRYRRYAKQAVKHARWIKKSDGSEIGVIPVFTLSVSNRCGRGTPGLTCSTQHGKFLVDPAVDPTLRSTLKVAIEELEDPSYRIRTGGQTYDAPPVDGIAFWVGDAERTATEMARDGLTMDDMWNALYCFGDFDADGALTVFDLNVFTQLHGRGDPRADIDRDGDLDTADVVAMANVITGGCP